MIFARKLSQLSKVPVSSALAEFSLTDRTTAFLTAGTGEYGRLPDMPVAAAPPNLFMAAQRHHISVHAPFAPFAAIPFTPHKVCCTKRSVSFNRPSLYLLLVKHAKSSHK